MDAPLGKIPVLVKAGSIIPFGNVEQYAGEDRSGELELRVFPGADADFTLYEDEGVNYAYEKGIRSTISFHWDDRLHVLTIGERHGSFPGLIENRQLTVHIAGANERTDKRVMYTGQGRMVEFK
jgi:alpha-D-xyloside xylohydrolase